MSSVSSDIHTGVHKAPRRPSRAMRVFGAAAWWIASVGLFAGVWELCWWFNWLNSDVAASAPHAAPGPALSRPILRSSTRVGTHSDITIILTVISVARVQRSRPRGPRHRVRSEPCCRTDDQIFALVRVLHPANDSGARAGFTLAWLPLQCSCLAWAMHQPYLVYRTVLHHDPGDGQPGGHSTSRFP